MIGREAGQAAGHGLRGELAADEGKAGPGDPLPAAGISGQIENGLGQGFRIRPVA